jgi:hypothetical protein
MRPAMGQWDQGSERHRLNRERVQFCGTSPSINSHVVHVTYFLF